MLGRSCTQWYRVGHGFPIEDMCHVVPAPRQQRAITIRSNHALARLTLLTRGGRGQVQVIEEVLDQITTATVTLELTTNSVGVGIVEVLAP